MLSFRNKEYYNNRVNLIANLYLSMDIESLRCERILFASSAKNIDNQSKMIPLYFTLILFFSNYFNHGVDTALSKWELINDSVFGFATIIILILNYFWAFIIQPQKLKEQQLDLEVLDYCIGLRERNPDLNYAEILNIFNKAFKGTVNRK
ncbi:hypothetical protein [Sporolactobacillus pectinivorans]|uniref:hypothetical protein n=1 Tax=Sporolactobacillus pectinivorans TaxID=1591408 RepID=UPI000C260ACB|nr:hypothetical protein [Sporolactobacillus pectinivorans]